MRNAIDTVKETFQAWVADKASQYAAALSFYTLLALAPLLLIAVAVAGFVYGPGAARAALLRQIDDRAGAKVADAVRTILTNAHRPGGGVAAIVVGTLLLLLGSSGVFSIMRTALDAMWDVRVPPARGLLARAKGAVVTRLANAVLVIGVALCLLALLAVSVAWTWMAGRVSGSLPAAELVLRAADLLLTLGLLTLLFAALFRFAASSRPRWADVWLGAFVTALLFDVGRLAIGLYLARSTTASSFGAAGSVVALLLWMYYSALIVFFGAEFTRVHLRRSGRQTQAGAPPVASPDEQRRLAA